ncbi:hypothetical protein DFJ77DRAFT_527977, partial [Powellomyces hirtus]
VECETLTLTHKAPPVPPRVFSSPAQTRQEDKKNTPTNDSRTQTAPLGGRGGGGGGGLSGGSKERMGLLFEGWGHSSLQCLPRRCRLVPRHRSLLHVCPWNLSFLMMHRVPSVAVAAAAPSIARGGHPRPPRLTPRLTDGGLRMCPIFAIVWPASQVETPTCLGSICHLRSSNLGREFCDDLYGDKTKTIHSRRRTEPAYWVHTF